MTGCDRSPNRFIQIMLREIHRNKLSRKKFENSVSFSKSHIRISENIVSYETQLLQDAGYEVSDKALYFKISEDEDGQFWFALLPYKVKNSLKVIKNEHKTGYTYYRVTYNRTARIVDGINIDNGSYIARKVQETSGFRWRNIDSRMKL